MLIPTCWNDARLWDDASVWADSVPAAIAEADEIDWGPVETSLEWADAANRGDPRMIRLVRGDVQVWRVNVTEGGVAKSMVGATVTASLKINGTAYAMSAALAAGNTGADVVVDTSDVPAPGVGVVQCRFALGGEIRTAEETISIARTAF